MKFFVVLLIIFYCVVSVLCKRVIFYNRVTNSLGEETVRFETSNILDVPLRSCAANEQRDPRGRCRRVVR